MRHRHPRVARPVPRATPPHRPLSLPPPRLRRSIPAVYSTPSRRPVSQRNFITTITILNRKNTTRKAIFIPREIMNDDDRYCF
ncbi:hypothetical protein V5799_010292 [Amblyomma americanum]|uniref:Uncharacterized protein n=1 Tax=Amblyomma americanum TaxID=6943 RepID=A0AAQ4F814_AMBAM